jgi:hypothetical protein
MKHEATFGQRNAYCVQQPSMSGLDQGVTQRLVGLHRTCQSVREGLESDLRQGYRTTRLYGMKTSQSEF